MNFKSSFWLLIFISSAQAQILYLDLNKNDLEKEAAIEAAKESGQEIVVYPDSKDDFKNADALELLKNTAPTTLFISGHDGGGSYSGDAGESMMITEIWETITENPHVEENLQVLGLMGCNTANHSDVSEAITKLSNLAIVAGFDGTAPSQKWVQGRNYIQDIILKTPEILKQKDEKTLKDVLDSFRNMDDLEASIYVDMKLCHEEGDDQFEGKYIYRPQMYKEELRYKLFDSSECVDARNEYLEVRNYDQIFEAYKSGEKELPEDRSSGELRELYTFVSQFEHCFEADVIADIGGDFPSANDVLFLLFYDDVHKSYFEYYGNAFDDAFENLKMFEDKEELKKRINQYYDAEIEIRNKKKAYAENIDTFILDVKKYRNSKQEELNKIGPTSIAKYEELVALADKMGLKDKEWHELTENEQKFIVETWEQQPMEVHKVGSLKSDLESIDKVLKLGVNSEGYQDILEDVKNIEADEEERREAEQNPQEGEFYVIRSTLEEDRKEKLARIDTYFQTYQDLPAKNMQELKKLDRKQLGVFINKLGSLDLEYTLNPDYAYGLKNSANTILYNLDGEAIPFQWHDINAGKRVDPKYSKLTDIEWSKENDMAIDLKKT
jgi:hypothetical protein